VERFRARLPYRTARGIKYREDVTAGVTTALVFGITGQDGSYLAEQLLEKGYEVHGAVRRLSVPNLSNIRRILPHITLHDCDLTDQTSIDQAVKESEPDEVYNLAAQSFVGVSFTQPAHTAEVTGLGALRVLEAVRRFAEDARVYQASSSEMFGSAPAPQHESTAFHPRSPYGAAKVFAHHSAVLYREAYGMFVSCGILFNHESPRRGEEFVTRKISKWAASLMVGRPYVLELGDTGSRRDWGFAPDYTDLAWRIMQHDRGDDFVGATGVQHSVEDFLVEALRVAGTNPVSVQEWVRTRVGTNMRPADVTDLRGDAMKAKLVLGWEPRTSFPDLVRVMVHSDLAAIGGVASALSDGRPIFGAAVVSGTKG